MRKSTATHHSFDMDNPHASIPNTRIWSRLDTALRVLRDAPELTVREVQNQKSRTGDDWFKVALYLEPVCAPGVKVGCITIYETGSFNMEFSRGDLVECETWQRMKPCIPKNPGSRRYLSLLKETPVSAGSVLQKYGKAVYAKIKDGQLRVASKGEEKMRQILLALPTQRQITSWCAPDDIRAFSPLLGGVKFDFMLDGKIIIEVDGEQHDKPVPFWNRNGEGERQIERDRAKEEACKALGYPLIRVPSYGKNPLAVMGRTDLAKLLDDVIHRVRPGELVRIDEEYLRSS